MKSYCKLTQHFYIKKVACTKSLISSTEKTRLQLCRSTTHFDDLISAQL